MMTEGVFHRIEADYSDESKCFELKDRNFKSQYAQIYAARLTHERDSLEDAARRKWGSSVPVRRLSELRDNEKCAIIGTLFKQMVYKPSILKELSEDRHLVPQPIKERFTDSSDYLILEDELQRIHLTGNVNVTFGVTGVVAVALGTQESGTGKFIVEEMSYRTMAAQNPMPALEEDECVLFVSGLEIGGGSDTEKGDSDQHLFEVQLLMDLVNGSLGSEEVQRKMSKVIRVIIAGNSLSSSVLNKEAIINTRGRRQQNRLQAKGEEKETRGAVKDLDYLLLQLAVNCDVDVMPGWNDPTSYAFPQRPLHPCLLPRSSTLSTLHLVPNPYKCKVSGFDFLGCSGQPVRDIISVTEHENHLEVLEKTLLYGHVAPTAPDTLGCFPYADHDPFCVSPCPHVYFSGNSPSFEWKNFTGEGGQRVVLVTVPTFRTSKTAVLLNLRSMQCEAISFNVG